MRPVTRLTQTMALLALTTVLSACGTLPKLRTSLKGGPTIPSSENAQTETYGPYRSDPQIDLAWPLREYQISRGFLPKVKRKRAHRGVDLAAPRGTDVFSAHNGIVTYAGRDFKGYGKLIIIETENWATFYSHCSKIYVKEGEKVNQGQVIAAVGSTGRSTGPHLHFELRYDRASVDPMPFLQGAPMPGYFANPSAQVNRVPASESQQN